MYIEQHLCELQVGGLSAVIIGICARLDNKHDDLMSQLPTLPALLLIAVGAVGSFVGFIGFLGAVRESFCLLKMVKSLLLNNLNADYSVFFQLHFRP